MKTRFMGVLLVAVLALATVPAGYASENATECLSECEWDKIDPLDEVVPKFWEKYGHRGKELAEILMRKPDEELTWEEAYYIMHIEGHPHPNPALDSEGYLEKAKHYGQIMLERRDTKQTRTLYYHELGGAYYDKYKETNDPHYVQKGLEYELKYIETSPELVYPGYFNGDLTELREHGYDVPSEAGGFFYEACEVTSERGGEPWKCKNIKTQEDLREAGYYEWKEESMEPLLEQEGPSVTGALKSGPANTAMAAYYQLNDLDRGDLALIGAGVFLIVSLGFAVRELRRGRRPPRRRH